MKMNLERTENINEEKGEQRRDRMNEERWCGRNNTKKKTRQKKESTNVNADTPAYQLIPTNIVVLKS